MKRSVLVIWHDRWHPDTTYEKAVGELFGAWDLKTDKSMRTLAGAAKAPDLAILLSAGVANEDSLSEGEQNAICGMAESGMGVLFIHAGLTRIALDSPMYNLARARFIMHPEGRPPVYNGAMPGAAHPVMEGIEPFEEADEHYFCYVDAEKTRPFLFSRSEHGTELAGWAHEYGKGRVCCLTAGHTAEIVDKMKPIIASAASWLVKEK